MCLWHKWKWRQRLWPKVVQQLLPIADIGVLMGMNYPQPPTALWAEPQALRFRVGFWQMEDPCLDSRPLASHFPRAFLLSAPASPRRLPAWLPAKLYSAKFEGDMYGLPSIDVEPDSSNNSPRAASHRVQTTSIDQDSRMSCSSSVPAVTWLKTWKALLFCNV